MLYCRLSVWLSLLLVLLLYEILQVLGVSLWILFR